VPPKKVIDIIKKKIIDAIKYGIKIILAVVVLLVFIIFIDPNLPFAANRCPNISEKLHTTGIQYYYISG